MGKKWIALSAEVFLMTSYTPLPCRFESSWGHDDAVCVNGWQFSSGCGGFTGYFPVPIQLETTQAFLHHQTVL